MPGVRTREDRRVVGERHRRQRRDRAVPERDPHLDEACNIRRFATRSHVVQHVRVGAVEQEADDMARLFGRIEHVVEHRAVLACEVGAVGAWRAAEERGDGRRDVDEAGRQGRDTEPADPLAGEHQWGACLHDARGPVLAPVPALVLPVVGGRVDDAQVGGGGGVEELGDLVVAVGIGVLPAVGMEVSALRGERRVGAGVLAAERVGALLSDDLPAGVGTPEADHPVGRERFVAAVAAGEDHVDDGLEGRVEQHGEGSVDLGPVLGRDLVPRAGFGNRRHAPNLSAVPGPCLSPRQGPSGPLSGKPSRPVR